LNARKPSSVNWPGERSSQAQNAVSGRPAALMIVSMRGEPVHQRHRRAKAIAPDFAAGRSGDAA